MTDSRIGRSVDQYQIIGREDRDDGVVYRAYDTLLGRKVTVILLPEEWADDADLRQRFLREARLVGSIRHRNILTVYEAGTTDDGKLYIVTEYIEGITLKRRLAAERRLPLTDAINITRQVAEALSAAYAEGVIHRDLTPSNILLTENGVKIVGFVRPTLFTESRTTDSDELASFAYKSPEWVRGEAVDARSEVWSVGAILYEMLAGHVPFRGLDLRAPIDAIHRDTPESFREQRSDIPDEIEHIVFRALHEDPDLRYETAQELAQVLSTTERRGVPADATAVVMARAEVINPLAAGYLFSDDHGHEWRRRSVYTVVAVAAVAIVVSLWRIFSGRDAATTTLEIMSVAGVVSIAALMTFGLRHIIELVAAIQLVAKLRRKE